MSDSLKNSAISLLKELIKTQSFSKEENLTADIIQKWLEDKGAETSRDLNNVWATNKYFDAQKPTILLNSHHDTVKPNKGYTNDPFDAFEKDGKLFGLGSNDAGGALVSLLATFVHYYETKNLKYNLVMAATAEEEISGANGIALVYPKLPEIDFAIVGEPTEQNLAIAEKGLMVVDGAAKGIPGHAAHENTENAIHNAIEDIEWIRNYEFGEVSELLGKVKMSVTQINAGQQHNLVPADCSFVVDVRVNEKYTNEQVFQVMNNNTKSELSARSFRLSSSSIPEDHPIVKAGIKLGKETYGSPTMSDQALMPCPSLKMGPGVSSRSHSADEFIYISEVEQAVDTYIKLLEEIL